MNRDEKSIGITINKTSKCIRHGLEAWSEGKMGSDISPQKGRLLGYLFRYPQASSSDIQKAFGLSKSSVSEMINSLVEAGYLVYQKSDEDKRQRNIELTEKGSLHVQKAHKVMMDYEAIICQGLSQEDRKNLEHILSVVTKNAEEVMHEKGIQRK